MTTTSINLLRTASPGIGLKYVKFSRPKINAAMPRPRLFDRLNRLIESHQVIWITSPPGAGKTTLVASYLSTLDRAEIWYDVDESDSDAGTLYYFLQGALETLSEVRDKHKIEENPEWSQFPRLFFRDFYSKIPEGTILVLDNLHEFDWKNSGRILEYAFSEIPKGITLIASSRQAPPSHFAKMELDGDIGKLDWNDLRFNSEEVIALAEIDAQPDEITRHWIDVIDGWAAGVILLRNSLQTKNEKSAFPEFDGRDGVFRYFAGEIFRHMPDQYQQILMRLSCLNAFSSDDVLQLTSDPESVSLLKSLYKNNFFVQFLGGENQRYQFHRLFKEFLQSEFAQNFEMQERNAILERASVLLEDSDRIEEAAQLIQQTNNHSRLVNLLLNSAMKMMEGGRGQTWRDWLSSLPLEIVELHPTLWYWHGISLNEIAPRRARQLFIRAERSFREAGKTRSRLLTIAAIIQGFDTDWSDHHLLSPWIEELATYLDQSDVEAGDTDLDLILNSRLLLGLMIAEPNSQRLSFLAEKTRKILALAINPVERLVAGEILLRYFESGVDEADLGIVYTLINELNGYAEDSSISPANRVKWYGRVARWYSRDGHHEESTRITSTSKDIISNYNLNSNVFQFIEANHFLGVGDLSAARQILDQLQKSSANLNSAELMEFHEIEANWHSRSGDIRSALESINQTIQICSERLLPAIERSKFEHFQAICFALLDDFDSADHSFEEAKTHAYGFESSIINESRQFINAYKLWKKGDEPAANIELCKAVENHRQRKATTLFHLFPHLAAQLVYLALQGNIEVEHIREIIKRQKLIAPNRYIQFWPWSVKIRVFGKVELVINEKPFEFVGKPQQRPLMLLKALVVYGDQGKKANSLATQLWPDSDDPKSTLNVTIHRLRKMLPGPDIVTVAGGLVCLSDKNVWSDYLAFSRLCGDVEALPAVATNVEVLKHSSELLRLYRGPFCDGESGNWAISVRENTRNRFIFAADSLGQRLEKNQHWDFAISLYQRALEAEPLAESSYRGLIRCWHAKGDDASAVSTYRRCRQMLSVIAGLSPSPETVNLLVSLGIRL